MFVLPQLVGLSHVNPGGPTLALHCPSKHISFVLAGRVLEFSLAGRPSFHPMSADFHGCAQAQWQVGSWPFVNDNFLNSDKAVHFGSCCSLRCTAIRGIFSTIRHGNTLA